MKILKTKGFFIKSFFILIFLTFFTAIISRNLVEPYAYNYIIKDWVSSQKQASADTVIISIDDKSISYHRWPWPREYYGKIMDFLTEYSNPKVVGFDAIIPGYDKENPESDSRFFKSVGRAKKLVVGFDATSDYVTDIEQTKQYNKKFKDKFQTVKITKTPLVTIPPAYIGVLESPPPYFDAAKYAGSVKVSTDIITGILTRANLVISVNGDLYPSLSLRMFMLANGDNDINLTSNKLFIGKAEKSLSSYPAYSGISSNIWFYGNPDEDGYTHKKYSASDIIRSYDNLKQGKSPVIDPKVFDGKVVFIGACAKAKSLSLEDALPTPIHDKQPGTDIQATIYDNISASDFIRPIRAKDTFIVMGAAIVLTFIFIWKLPFFLSLILSIFLAILYLVFVLICYKNGYAVALTPPLAIQLVTSIFGYSYRFILEGKNKEKIKNAMGKYLSQDVMQNVVQNIDEVKLGGKKATVTVLFSDIRGFTSMSENLSAEEVSNILNEYFSEMEPIITAHNGVINKFIGDAVMAIFGEPIQDLNHPVNAVKCAYAMLKKVDELQEKWIFEGKPKIEIGIGINTGEAFVGNIGSEKRLEYTVIGDTVNLASRIEGYNKLYHTNLLVSSSTYSYISDIAYVIKISDVQIRGKSKKMDIYEVLKLNDDA